MAARKPEAGPAEGSGIVQSRPRIAALDAARGSLVLAMIACHGAWDLWAFGWLETTLPDNPAWQIAVRLVAGGFLAIAGVNLVLAQRGGFRLAAFLRRLGVLAAAASAVSLGSWFMAPDSFVYFGILHGVALGSVLALPLLRAPAWLVALAASGFLLAGPVLASDIFNGFTWYWLGLSTLVPPSVDYIPIFPWFGAMLLGVLAGKWLSSQPIRPCQPSNAPLRWLTAAGRWSLAIYLIHQPVLIGLLNLVAMLNAPAGKPL